MSAGSTNDERLRSLGLTASGGEMKGEDIWAHLGELPFVRGYQTQIAGREPL